AASLQQGAAREVSGAAAGVRAARPPGVRPGAADPRQGAGGRPGSPSARAGARPRPHEYSQISPVGPRPGAGADAPADRMQTSGRRKFRSPGGWPVSDPGKGQPGFPGGHQTLAEDASSNMAPS